MHNSEQTRFKRLLTAASLAALAAGLAGVGHAQQAADTGKLDVIIVSAQRYDQDIQKVPLSVTSLAEENVGAIFSAGDDITALSAKAPSLYVESSNGRAAPRFYIRGLGNTDFDLAASQPVSVIMDDVVMENVTLKSMPLYDLDTVEVSRGPQGTLFGRNTTAGIVKFTTARPTDTFEWRAAGTYGTYGTATLDAAASGPLTADGTLKARLSGLWQHRDEWIDNTTTPEDGDLGDYEERAGRFQLEYTPNEKLDMLLNVSVRDLDGTSAVFRGDAVSKGSNKLNSNYNRDVVTYDGGGRNRQAYEGWVASGVINYDFGDIKLTSISAVAAQEGESRGDVDGTAGPYTFNFGPTQTYPEIAIESDTKDSIRDLVQQTQEVRLASDTPGSPLTWQTGFFWFQSRFDVTTEGAGFPPPATIQHRNKSWAVYGQASYAFTDALTVTGGLRYTEDDKKLYILSAPIAPTAVNEGAEDDHVSWDLSAMYAFTPSFSVYGRVADGFRGPSIQARDVAFGSPASVADSETIISYEAGWKSTLLDNTLRLNGTVYTYTVSDMQLTAVGGSGNLIQLINADKGKAVGFDLDAEWSPMANLVFTGGFSYVDTEIDDPNLLVAPNKGQATNLDPLVTTPGGTFALADGNPFPNAPETIANFTARYAVPFGSGGELFAFTDWSYQGKTNIFLYESVEFQTDDQFEGGLKLGYAKTDGSYEVALFARNITDEDNIKGAIDFSNNTVFVNEPRIIGISVKINR